LGCQATRQRLVYVLKRFCERQEPICGYRQGLSEIVAIFPLAKPLLALPAQVNILEALVEKFGLGVYSKDGTDVLCWCFMAIRQLVMYHDCVLAQKLRNGCLDPSMFVTSWILSLYLQKNNDETCLAILDKVLGTKGTNDRNKGYGYFGEGMRRASRQRVLQATMR
jgi:hypothetical protein